MPAERLELEGPPRRIETIQAVARKRSGVLRQQAARVLARGAHVRRVLIGGRLQQHEIDVGEMVQPEAVGMPIRSMARPLAGAIIDREMIGVAGPELAGDALLPHRVIHR